MKTGLSIRFGRFIAPTALLLGVATSTFAQTAIATSPVTVPTETSATNKGYWRLHVEAGTHTTLIDFYSRDHQLVYQESIMDRPVRLTPENCRLLDQVTERLTETPLLASAATGSERLVPATRLGNSDVLTSHELAMQQNGFRINSYVTSKGVLKVGWLNPDGNPVELSLLDDRRVRLFNERSSLSQFRRGYNLGQLPDGTYTLRITHNGKPHTYRVSLQNLTYQIESKNAGSLVDRLTQDDTDNTR